MFKIYRSDYDLFKGNKKIIKAFKREGIPTDLDGITRFSSESAQMKNDELATLISAEEYGLLKDGHKIVFPESVELIDSLLSADFDLAKGANIQMPFDFFSLAVPKGYHFKGTSIQPLMIHFISHNERKSLYVDEFSRLTNNPIYDDGTDTNEKLLSVTFKCKDDASVRTTIRLSELPMILKARNADDFISMVMETSTMRRPPLDPTDKEREQQFLSVKLAVALGVYNSAVGGLEFGYPSSKIDIPKHNTRINYKAFMMPNQLSKGVDRRSPHYVAPFFRCLKHEKYYTGEHSTKPRGSRWTLVSDHVRGSDEHQPFTQKK